MNGCKFILPQAPKNRFSLLEQTCYNLDYEVQIMDKYFYIWDFIFTKDRAEILSISGYFTDSDHKLFSPHQTISRGKALDMIKAGICLFLHDGCYRKVFVKIACVKQIEYLRVDHFPHPQDYFG